MGFLIVGPQFQLWEMRSKWSVWIPLITENWKYCNKIIVKCVNSVVGSRLEVIFAERGTCGSCEQCTKPTQGNAYMETRCYPNPLKECAVSKEILSGTTRLAY